MAKKSELFDLVKILNLVKEKWYICVSFALAFALLTGVYFVYIKDEQFAASSTIFVYSESAPSTTEGGANYTDVLTAEKLAKDCQIIATSNAVLNEVRTQIPNIAVDPENISVSLVPNSRIIELSVIDTNPYNAKAIANSVSDKLIKVAMEKVKIQEMEVIDYAPLPLTPIENNLILFISLAAFLGILIGVGIILAMAAFNKTIHTADDITENFDIPVLVSIPEFDSLEKQLKSHRKHNKE